MEKSQTFGHLRSSVRKRSLKSTPLLFLLFFFAVFSVVAKGYCQEGGISLKLHDVSLKEVFKELKSLSGYTFVYSESMLKGLRLKELDLQNASIKEVLDESLKNTDLDYYLQQKVVVIRKATPKLETLFQQENHRIQGKVSDEDGNPLPGVSVVIKGTNIGAATDENGMYVLEFGGNDVVLVFSFIGMISREIEYTGQSSLNLVLKEDTKQVDEVVVTGMFVRKAETYTGSARVVTSEELLNLGNRNLLVSLRNFDPSFNIVENNLYGGDPNRLPEVEIRGNATLPNVGDLQDATKVQLNTPLIIIDGFESNLRKLMDLDETEVETITLLKDAAATAIYGSRAANGVVVIATRVPKSGKLSISYRGEVKINAPDLTSYKLLNAREKLELERKTGLYSRENHAATDLALKKYYNFLMNEVNRGVDTYWLSKPLQTGVGQRHNIRLEGGDRKFRYSASVQYNSTKGVMKGSGREVLNGSINLSYTHKKIRFTNSLMIGTARGDQSPYGSFFMYAQQNPYWRSHDENGNVIKKLGDPGEGIPVFERWGQNGLPLNPLYNASLHQFNYDNLLDVAENMSVIWNALEALKITASLGINKGISQSHLFKPADHTDFSKLTGEDYFRRGSYTYGIGNTKRYNARLNLFYNKVFYNKHHLSIGVDLSANSSESSNYVTVGEGFSNESLDYLPAALQYQKDNKPGGSESLSRTVGFTSFVNYSFNNIYFAELSYRIDGSSQFGKDKRYAPFWSCGLGWNLHNTKLVQKSEFINRLKVRASVGITGSQNFNSYQALSTYRYNTSDRYLDLTGANLLALGNENLKWQQTLQYNLGFDLQIFKNRILVDADYYFKTTNGMISSVTIPLVHGFSSYVDNIGKVNNKGFELRITAYLIRDAKRKITWSVTGTGAHNTNKIVELSEALKEAQKSMETNKSEIPTRFYREGESTNAIYAVPSEGIDPSNGKEIYIDRFGNTTYFWNGLDQVAVGTTEPSLRGSINTAFRYKNFTANASFGYQFGGQQYNQTLINKVEVTNYDYNVDRRVYDDRWQKPGDKAQFKGLMSTERTYATTRFVQDDNKLNCQNINLSYELRSKQLNRVLGLRVITFKANIDDVFYLSTVKRERGTSYPFDRQFSLGVSAIF